MTTKVKTVDEILEAGIYVDRTEYVWMRDHDDHIWVGWRQWFRQDQMRQYIIRDQHRNECPGLYDCTGHPVPAVHHGDSGGWHTPRDGWICHESETWAEALDKANEYAKENTK